MGSEGRMSEIKVDVFLDAKGMHCPMHVLKTKKVIDTMQSGQVMEIIATDPGSKSDISELLSRLGHKLLQINEKGGEIAFYIKKI